MIYLELSVIHHSDKTPDRIIKSLAKEIKVFPNLFWTANISWSRSWGVEFGFRKQAIGLLIAGFGFRLTTELYRDTGQPDEDYVSMVVYPSSSRPPLPHELEPKLEYCWWWNSHEYAWEYADCRHCDLSIYTHFMDWRAIPHPGMTYAG